MDVSAQIIERIGRRGGFEPLTYSDNKSPATAYIAYLLFMA